jgi:adenine-specific DNA-methyltransferase
MARPAPRKLNDLDLILSAGDQAVLALESASVDADRIASARAFGVRSVAAWWENLQAGAERPQPLRPLLREFALAEFPSSLEQSAHRFGAMVAGMRPELAAYAIGRAYTEMLPQEYRARLGVYYTPPSLTDRLIEQATNAGTSWINARVLDPACGGGAFLAPVAQRIIDALPGCSPHILLKNIATRLRGYEIDPFAAWLSQVTLDAVLLPISSVAGRAIPAVVDIRDSLRDAPAGAQFDLVIGNPPYGRVRLDEAQRMRFGRSLYGHANLYGVFTDVALQHTVAGGVIAYVTPTSFLAGQYFKNLRSLLTRDAPPASIDFIEARKGVFGGVLQETLLATYVRSGAARPVQVNIITPVPNNLSIAQAGHATLPADASLPWLLPRKPGEARFVRRLSEMSCRLANWGYEVSTGPLVWNRHKDQLADEPGANRAPLIWAEAVTSDGRFRYRAIKRNHRPYFELRPEDAWLMVDTPCVLVQRTTAKEQARRLIAAELPGSFLVRHGGVVVVENHLNMVRSVPGATPAVALDVLVAFLNSAAVDRAFRCVSGSVAVSAYELESLPLPDPENLGRLAALVANGAGREQVEAECNHLYVTGDEFPTALRQPRNRRRTPAGHLSGRNA